MKRRLLTALLLLTLLAAGWWLLHDRPALTKAKSDRKEGPPTVAVAAVREAAVPFSWPAVGRVEPFHAVAVRPQAGGLLQAVEFREGERVTKGQLLFRIDPAPAKAALAEAAAQLAKDQATLANAQWQERRQRALQGNRYASAQEYENARALVAETEAAIALDRAAIDRAAIALGYCEIRAPIDGYTGAVTVQAGNLVKAEQDAPLVTIHRVDPALVAFSVPQSELAALRAAERAGTAPTVRLRGDAAGREGVLLFIDNAIDAASGTILLKARFANPVGDLWPGQYLDLDLISGVEPHALTIPETALQQGRDGPFVYLVAAGKATVRAVTAGRHVDGAVVIAGGLTAGERVVTRVPRRLADGAAVAIQAGDSPVPPGTAPP